MASASVVVNTTANTLTAHYNWTDGTSLVEAGETSGYLLGITIL